ncbi:MAG: hypothetical protein HOP18_20805 [Deltaproteobacteria bacterium]|nr:hypothetical protein [Deltaproteobacteria bacterium]
MTTPAYEQLIIQGIKGLPPETLAEIADFIYFVRQRVSHSHILNEELQSALDRGELKNLSRTEEAHLEEEFVDYEQRYPRE